MVQQTKQNLGKGIQAQDCPFFSPWKQTTEKVDRALRDQPETTVPWRKHLTLRSIVKGVKVTHLKGEQRKGLDKATGIPQCEKAKKI